MASTLHEKLIGIFPALPTPLKRSGELDAGAVPKLVEHLIKGGVNGLWVCGSGGEFASLSPQMRIEMVQLASQAAKGRMPVLAGVSDSCFSQTIQYAEAAHAAGASGVFATTPYYFIPQPEEIVAFYNSLADRSPLPVMIYHNPFNAKGRLTAALLSELADHPNIAGIKDSSCDLALFQEFLKAVGGRADFRVFQGHDPLVLPSVALGADGAVLAAAMLAPALVAAGFKATREGNLAEMRRYNQKISALSGVFNFDGSGSDRAFLAGQKAALEIMGLCSRYVAPPFQALESSADDGIRSILVQAGVLGGN